MNKKNKEIVENLINELSDVIWFGFAGQPFFFGNVVDDIVDGWDSWNCQMLDTWEPRTLDLEEKMRQKFRDEEIDEIFTLIQKKLGMKIRQGLQVYFDHRPVKTENQKVGADMGLLPELVEKVVQDISWAAIERILNREEFFNEILSYYIIGRWPCAWDGDFPIGNIVVL